MTVDNEPFVRRALTDRELADILTAITTATTPSQALVIALKSTFGILLADQGLTWDEFNAERKLDGKRYQIPDYQWHKIAAAMQAQAERLDPIGLVNLLLDWMNIGPSSYTASQR